MITGSRGCPLGAIFPHSRLLAPFRSGASLLKGHRDLQLILDTHVFLGKLACIPHFPGGEAPPPFFAANKPGTVDPCPDNAKCPISGIYYFVYKNVLSPCFLGRWRLGPRHLISVARPKPARTNGMELIVLHTVKLAWVVLRFHSKLNVPRLRYDGNPWNHSRAIKGVTVLVRLEICLSPMSNGFHSSHWHARVQ